MSSEPNRDSVIIFVHGLSGNSEGTWGKMIEQFRRDRAFRNYDLDTYEYPTCKINWAFWQRMPGIAELADGLATFISTFHADKKNIILIGHSLGGLVLRHYILTEFKRESAAPLIAAIMIATPHTGAALGRIGSSLSFRHVHLRQLTRNGDILKSMLDDWSNLRIEQKIDTLYVTGGMDAIVDIESSKPFYGNDRSKNLISYGHVDVIKPDHSGDIRYTVLRKFIEALDTSKKPEGGASSLTGSPLFYRYSLENEKFYLVRKFDHDISEALSNSNIWLSGPPGVGKSVALTRAILKDGWHLLYLTLDGFNEMSADGLLREISCLLQDRTGLESKKLPESYTRSDCLRSITTTLSSIKQQRKIAIFVEEIPITDDAEYSKFINNAYHLSTLQDSLHAQFRLTWVFSSILDPSRYFKDQGVKLRERFCFSTIEYWADSDTEKLFNLICCKLNIVFSQEERIAILSAVSGSPRRLKMFIKARQTESGSKKELAELLSETVLETP